MTARLGPPARHHARRIPPRGGRGRRRRPVPGALSRPCGRPGSRAARRARGAGGRPPPPRPDRGRHGQVRRQRPAPPRPPRSWTWTSSRAGSGGWARPMSCAARAPRSTSATTSTTSRARSLPAPLSVSVLTGGCTREELVAAGTHVVLDDLAEFPAWLDEHLLTTRLAALEADLAAAGRCWSPSAVAPTAPSCSPPRSGRSAPTTSSRRPATPTPCPQSERDPARAFAESLGVRVLTPRDPRDGARAGYRANAGDRCFFCKAELLDVLTPLAAEHGLAYVATGTNADDAVAGFRPGIRAAAERGAITPLRDAGLTKAQVRRGVAALGAADLGQARRRLPLLAGRVRRRGDPVPAGPGGAGRGGRPRRCWPRPAYRA